MKGSRATNFKINSKGQLRHFNCTILGHIENVERGIGGEGRGARSKKEKRGDREEAGGDGGGKGERRERRTKGWRGGGDGRAQEMTDQAHTRIIIITLLDRDGSERRALPDRLRRALKYYTYQRENN